MEEPPSATKPVVVDLELLLEPSICELALDVNNDDCTLTLERSGLPDLSLERGSQVVEGLPAATVSDSRARFVKGPRSIETARTYYTCGGAEARRRRRIAAGDRFMQVY